MADSEYEESHVPEMMNERWGGPQGAQDDESDEDEDAAFKREERERKKADVRRRLEAVGRAKNVKRGFLTPERKKKLKQLLMAKAAEDLKQQQLMKEQERQRILNERIPDMPNIDDIDNKGELEKILNEMWDQLMDLEDVKYDLDIGVRQKDFEINELTIQVNDLRGKFVKPTLKKVKQFDNKFEKLQSTGTKKVDFRSTLNTVEKDKYAIEEVEKDKPAWA